MMASYNEYLADLGRVPVKKVAPAASSKIGTPVPGTLKPMPAQAIAPGEQGFVGPVATTPASSKATVPDTEYATQRIYDRYGNLVEVFSEGPNAGRAVETGELVLQGEAPEGTTPGVPGSGKSSYDNSPYIDTEMQDAYERLFREFKAIGLESLVTDAKDFLMKGIKPAEMPEALRGTKSYLDRFAGNEARIKAGLRALSPAEYLAKEDAYQNVMRQYGLPAEYYKPGINGKQENFEKLLASDIDDVELEERIATAQQRVLNTNPEVLKALKQFYPDIKDADILAYTLDPKNAIQNIKRKVTAAEIGGAALQQGLQALGGTAEALAGQGITKAQAQQGYAAVAEMAPRGGELAAIYGQDPYTQQTAEAEVFNTAGAAEAARKRKKLTALETAAFSGSSGVGALGRDRANSQSGAGAY